MRRVYGCYSYPLIKYVLQIGFQDAPLICRGDLFDGFLFISVGLIKLKENADSESVPGVVAIINADQDLVFWSWIFWPEEEIEFTYPQTTGISRDNLKIGLPLDQVRNYWRVCLKF